FGRARRLREQRREALRRGRVLAVVDLIRAQRPGDGLDVRHGRAAARLVGAADQPRHDDRRQDADDDDDEQEFDKREAASARRSEATARAGAQRRSQLRQGRRRATRRATAGQALRDTAAGVHDSLLYLFHHRGQGKYGQEHGDDDESDQAGHDQQQRGLEERDE